MSDRIQPTRPTTAPMGVERTTTQAGGAARNSARDRGQETYRLLADSVQANKDADAVAQATGGAIGKAQLNSDVKVADTQRQAKEAADTKASLRPTIEAATRRIQDFLQRLGRRFELDHSFDKEANKQVVTVRDSESGDIIRQIPPEETLRIARSVGYYQSALVNLQA
ncbi:MAG: flagellar protein FlaG [Betaproteobacteria bacterium]|nr:flagellar protein FlaG [Betaproteobacteria bacterium]